MWKRFGKVLCQGCRAFKSALQTFLQCAKPGKAGKRRQVKCKFKRFWCLLLFSPARQQHRRIQPISTRSAVLSQRDRRNTGIDAVQSLFKRGQIIDGASAMSCWVDHQLNPANPALKVAQDFFIGLGRIGMRKNLANIPRQERIASGLSTAQKWRLTGRSKRVAGRRPICLAVKRFDG